MKRRGSSAAFRFLRGEWSDAPGALVAATVLTAASFVASVARVSR